MSHSPGCSSHKGYACDCNADQPSLARVGPNDVVLTREQAQQQGLLLAREQRRAWDAERELAHAERQRDLLGERVQQLEALLASHFARSVRMLSGAQKQIGESQDAARAVAVLEDHLKALRLLNNNGVECDRVEVGVRLMLDQRDRVVEMPTERPPIDVVEVTVQASGVEVSGTYSLTASDFDRDERPTYPELPSKP